jgi:hypothetical protein
MAIVRCRMHAPESKVDHSLVAVRPAGFPNSALVCGSRVCDEPAYIWLDGAEKLDYDTGLRIFDASSAETKVRSE